MKDFELSQDAAAKLEEQVEETASDKDENSQDGDSVEQSLDVPTTTPEDEAAEQVQKQYKEKSGLELDDDSARGIVSTARAGGGSSGGGSASGSDSSSDVDSESTSEAESDSENDNSSSENDDSSSENDDANSENDTGSEKKSVKAESSGASDD